MDKQSQLDKRRVRSTKYQNPVLPVPQPQLSEFTVTGEVERISYEPVSEVERRIAAYAFLGLIGLEIFGDAGAMAAYTQYWFSIKDSNDKVLDSFVVIGASSAHPQKKSRKELMTEANYIAAVNFASELAFRIAKLKDLTLEHLPSTYYPLDIRILMYKNYFGLKLKSTEVR